MRNRKRKSEIGSFTAEQMASAVELVINQNYKIRTAASECQVNYVTLSRYVKKQKEADEGGTGDSVRMTPKYQSRLVFTAEQENSLAEYLVTCAKMCFGQSTRDTRELAYEMAMLNSIVVPPSWHEHSEAGLDWLRSFLKRNPNLSIRQPENCSLSRCTSFNKHTVKTFFDNLNVALSRSDHFSDGSRIWNLDETNTPTVCNKSVKVIAEKGSRGVNNVTAGERGTLVTTCCFVSASGNTMPPAFVFPRVKFRDHMLINAPSGSLGLASKSGWMTAENFPTVIKHFIKHTLTSKENPTLLIMDNHQTHISIEVIDLAKNNGITIVTLPPHCSAKLQPLDVSCYGPFKTYYAASMDSWNKRNPGKVFSIYDVAGCVNEAHQKAMTPSTIINGFRKTGIYPFNSDIFVDADFLSSYVTDRPNPETASTSEHISNESPTVGLTDNEKNEGGIAFRSPKEFRGYPKAGPRKNSSRKREAGRSMIATDTPEKEQIEEKAIAVAAKKLKKTARKKATKNLFNQKDEVSSDDDHDDADDWSDTSSAGGGLMSDSDGNEFPEGFGEEIKSVNVGDFVLVEFFFKKKFYYVGKINKEVVGQEDPEITYLRKSSKVIGSFFFPQIDDTASVIMKDIKLILPPPVHRKGTLRTNRFVTFDISFCNLDVR